MTFHFVADLDGTKLKTNSLYESAVRLLAERPPDILRLPYWLALGKSRVSG
jgi:hypothetical protein